MLRAVTSEDAQRKTLVVTSKKTLGPDLSCWGLARGQEIYVVFDGPLPPEHFYQVLCADGYEVPYRK